MADAITIRHSREADRSELRRLAELDSRHAPTCEALLAFVDGELRAALGADGQAVADPFELTADIMKLLRMRAGLEREGRRRGSAAARLSRAALVWRGEVGRA